MPTILELAEHAGVSAETVLRVVNGEPVNEDASTRVREAIVSLGPPSYPEPARPGRARRARQGARVRRARTTALAPHVVDAPAERARDQLLERFAQAAAELEAGLPRGVSSVVYEALRVEVRPVAQHVEQLSSLFERMIGRLESVDGSLESERQERIEDVALLIELVSTGWRGVDRRLARLESILQRLDEEKRPSEGGGGQVFHLGEHSNRPGED